MKQDKTRVSLLDAPLSAELVAALDRLFPERCPRPDQDERDIWMYAGKRDLVRALIAARRAKERGDERGVLE